MDKNAPYKFIDVTLILSSEFPNFRPIDQKVQNKKFYTNIFHASVRNTVPAKYQRK